MRLGLSLGMVYMVGAEGVLSAELGVHRLGGASAYAAPERR